MVHQDSLVPVGQHPSCPPLPPAQRLGWSRMRGGNADGQNTQWRTAMRNGHKKGVLGS